MFAYFILLLTLSHSQAVRLVDLSLAICSCLNGLVEMAEKLIFKSLRKLGNQYMMVASFFRHLARPFLCNFFYGHGLLTRFSQVLGLNLLPSCV